MSALLLHRLASCFAAGKEDCPDRQRGITLRIARKGIESSQRLGRYRWVVERTRAWLSRFRRLKVRYERRGDLHQAVLS